MKKMIIRILLLMLPALFLNAGSVLLPDSLVLQTVYAQDWKNEFVDICGKTDNAMSLSKEELKRLIERCDRLRLTVENQEETEKKVYLKRLRLCRELFAYVLESKEKDATPGSEAQTCWMQERRGEILIK
jgi:hypothetical protein